MPVNPVTLCQAEADRLRRERLEQLWTEAAGGVVLCSFAHGGRAICFSVLFALYIGASRDIQGEYEERLKPCDPASPLVLDLDGDGVEAGTARHFDHAGDGFAELTRWAGKDDGMLVWDRNADGKINDGSELFGNKDVLLPLTPPPVIPAAQNGGVNTNNPVIPAKAGIQTNKPNIALYYIGRVCYLRFWRGFVV